MFRTVTLMRRLAGCIVASAGCLLAALPMTAAAQFTNVVDYFELDGNIAQNSATKDDWTSINAAQASVLPEAAGRLVKRVFVNDGLNMSIFTGGGSKDPLDLSGALSSAGGWKHKAGSVPDKDEIINAYAAAYNISGDLVVYAGADRFDNSGDAFMGFWFFKSAVSLNANGSFNGTHTPGDVLVLANFTGGGTTVAIQVLEWDPSVAGNLKLLASSANATCGSPSASALYCGRTNAVGGEDPAWPYSNKDGGSTFLPATFFELGINISKVLTNAGAGTCFSAFLAETRSSSSVSATLKDFALGGFEVCGVAITKTCTSGQANANGTSIDYSFGGKIINTGFGALTNLALTDTPQPATPPAVVSTNYTFRNCTSGAVLQTGSATYSGPLAAGAEVCYSSTFNTTINASSNRIKVVASTSPTTTTEATSDTITCPLLTFPTGMSITKECTASLVSLNSLLVVKVDVSGQVCNQGNLALTNVSVIDIVQGQPTPPALTVLSTTLGPKDSASMCTTFSGYYFPLAPDLGTATEFSDAAKAQGTPPPITGVPQVTVETAAKGATCNLCAGPQCVTSDGTSVRSMLRSSTTKKK
jgi:hypothetical protein